jgi:dephospho-CoA kinase
MKLVGLSGGIACGKSTVAAMLRRRGLPVLDADVVARDVVAPGTEGLGEVVRRFGPQVLEAGGGLDRPLLRALVLADAEARRDLEAITHPRIRARVLEWAAAQRGEPMAMVEAALLVESGSWRQYDALVVVRCDRAQQIERLCRRNGIEPKQAEHWLAAQMPVDEKARHAHVVIDNSGDEAELERGVERGLAELRALLGLG